MIAEGCIWLNTTEKHYLSHRTSCFTRRSLGWKHNLNEARSSFVTDFTREGFSTVPFKCPCMLLLPKLCRKEPPAVASWAVPDSVCSFPSNPVQAGLPSEPQFWHLFNEMQHTPASEYYKPSKMLTKHSDTPLKQKILEKGNVFIQKSEIQERRL